MEIALYELASALHKEALKPTLEEKFIQELEKGLKAKFTYYGADFSTFGTHDIEYIFIRTGGTEGLFLQHFGHLFKDKSTNPSTSNLSFKLLTSGESNSLAASMEILAFLLQHGAKGEILHGKPANIAKTIQHELLPIEPFAPIDFGNAKLGVIGKPSDWLIASQVEAQKVKDKLNATMVDIPLNKLTERVFALQKSQNIDDIKGFEGSELIYQALKEIVSEYGLSGLTLRCFDLLTILHNTGCLALARLNSEGIPASCEGDIPALISMYYAYKQYGTPGFQCNLSRIQQGETEDALLFAHCTVPLNLCTQYSYTTHFESGIGTAIKGDLSLGKAEIFKISPDLESCVRIPGTIVSNSAHPNLCRTQITIHASHAAPYFLTHPLANHHIVIPIKKAL